ncbi:MAG: hypothetical protein H6552_08795 [Chitinophagales bacterium]|nr:hypothetical protein [Chitinophagales bacterium]
MSNATEIKEMALSDTVLTEIINLTQNDSSFLMDYYKISENINKVLSENDFYTVVDVLHQNNDTTYSNNQAAYSVAQLLIDKFFLVNDKLITQYANLFANGKDQFIENNMKKFLSRYFFQLFYAKGSQAELLRTEVQEAMQPKIIDDMIKKDPNLELLQHKLIFIAKNSNIKLYNI